MIQKAKYAMLPIALCMGMFIVGDCATADVTHTTRRART